MQHTTVQFCNAHIAIYRSYTTKIHCVYWGLEVKEVDDQPMVPLSMHNVDFLPWVPNDHPVTVSFGAHAPKAYSSRFVCHSVILYVCNSARSGLPR